MNKHAQKVLTNHILWAAKFRASPDLTIPTLVLIPDYSVLNQLQNNLKFIFVLFEVLEEDITTFVKEELKRIKNILGPEGSERLKETAGEKEQKKSNREAFVNIVLNLLRRRKQEDLANKLQNSKIESFSLTSFTSLCKISGIFVIMSK